MLPICILTIQDEDDRAYMSRLFVQYHRLMYQCTYEVLDDKWATEDAVQTTLLRLIDRIDVVRPHGPDPGPEKGPGYAPAGAGENVIKGGEFYADRSDGLFAGVNLDPIR